MYIKADVLIFVLLLEIYKIFYIN